MVKNIWCIWSALLYKFKKFDQLEKTLPPVCYLDIHTLINKTNQSFFFKFLSMMWKHHNRKGKICTLPQKFPSAQRNVSAFNLIALVLQLQLNCFGSLWSPRLLLSGDRLPARPTCPAEQTKSTTSPPHPPLPAVQGHKAGARGNWIEHYTSSSFAFFVK